MPVHSLCTPPLPPIGSTHTTHTTLMSSSSKRVNSLISTESDDGAALDAAPPALALTTGIIGVGGGIGDEEAPKKAKKTKKKAAKLKPQNPWGTPLDRAKGSLVTNGNVPVYLRAPRHGRARPFHGRAGRGDDAQAARLPCQPHLRGTKTDDEDRHVL